MERWMVCFVDLKVPKLVVKVKVTVSPPTSLHESKKIPQGPHGSYWWEETYINVLRATWLGRPSLLCFCGMFGWNNLGVPPCLLPFNSTCMSTNISRNIDTQPWFEKTKASLEGWRVWKKCTSEASFSTTLTYYFNILQQKKTLPPGVEAGWILNLLPNPAFKCSQVGPEKNSKTHFEALFKSSEPKKKSPQKNGFLYLSLQMHETSHSSAGRWDANFSKDACAASKYSASLVMFRMVQDALLKIPWYLKDAAVIPMIRCEDHACGATKLQACNAFNCCKTPSQPPSSMRFRVSDKNLNVKLHQHRPQIAKTVILCYRTV